MVIRDLLVRLGLDTDTASFASGFVMLRSLWGIFDGIKASIGGLGEGLIGFNSSVENIKLRLQTLAMLDLKQPIDEAKQSADKLFAGLQKDAIATPATTRELADFASTVAGVVFKAKGSLEDLRELTTGTVMAGKLFMGEGEQHLVSVQTQEALMGTVRVNQRFARLMIEQVMGMTREQFKALNPEQRKNAWLEGLRSDALKQAMKEYEQNWAGVTSSIIDIKEIILGAIGAPLFAALKRHLGDFKVWLQENMEGITAFGLKVYEVLRKTFIALWGVVKGVFGIILMGLKAMGVVSETHGGKMNQVLLLVIGTVLSLTAAVVAAGVSMAASWLAATLPILAIGAVLATIFLIGEDLWVAIHGGDSVLGRLWDRWKGFVEEWVKPKAGDWWITTIIKDAVNHLLHFQRTYADVKDAFLNLNPAGWWIQAYRRNEIESQGVRTFENGRRVADGDNLPLESFGWIKDHLAVAADEAKKTAAAQASRVDVGGITIHVHQAEADAEEIGRHVGKQMQEFWDGTLRDASVGVLR